MLINRTDSTNKKPVARHQVLMLLSFIINALNIAIAAFFYSRLQPQIPIFYSLAEKSEQMANKEWIFLLPLIGLAMAISHSLIITLNHQFDEFLWRLFAMVTLTFQVLLLIINLRIIWLII